MIKTGVPNLLIIAGPDGAGESTVVELLITERSIANCVNADALAQGMAIYPKNGG
jgi:predicted ABC-type ATPase